MILGLLLSAPIVIVVFAVAVLSSVKKDTLQIEAKIVENPVGSLTRNEIISAKSENRPVNEGKLSDYDISILHCKKCITAYIKDNYINADRWEVEDMNLLAEELFYLTIIFVSGERKKILVQKIPSINGYKFQELCDKPLPKPTPVVPDEKPEDEDENARLWVEKHLQQLISLKKAAIKKNADLFEYNELPGNLIEQIRNLLEIKGFFLSESDTGYCFRF